MDTLYLKAADRDGRAAVLPKRLTPGNTVWVWDQIYCREELCPDACTVACPVNAGADYFGDTVCRCRRNHPVLRSVEVQYVCCYFTDRGQEWIINDCMSFQTMELGQLWPSREAAMRHRPGVLTE